MRAEKVDVGDAQQSDREGAQGRLLRAGADELKLGVGEALMQDVEGPNRRAPPFIALQVADGQDGSIGVARRWQLGVDNGRWDDPQHRLHNAFVDAAFLIADAGDRDAANLLKQSAIP